MRARLMLPTLLLACAVGACSKDSPTDLVPVSSVRVTLAAPSLTVGGTTTATATVLDASGNALSGRAVSWSSSSPAIATVSASGMVSAVALGTASITATVGSKKGDAQLSVVSAVAASWTGVISSTGQTLILSLTEPQPGTVGGVGTLSMNTGGAMPLFISGQYVAPTIGLRFNAGMPSAFNLAGTINGKTMTASLTGGGFTGDAVTLTRP